MHHPHGVPSSLPALLLTAALASGCSSDTHLRLAPPATDDGADDGGLSLPPTGLGGPGGPGAPVTSPWANLDPGEIPDDLFAVAWLDLTTDCWGCSYMPTTPNRYDLVDALGRVVSSFALPFTWEDESWYRPELVSLYASGPGRFLVSNLVWREEGVEQVVWEANAFTGVATVLARLRPGEVELPLAGVTLPLPVDAWSWDERILPDPSDPTRLLIVPTTSSAYYYVSELRDLWSVSTLDPESPLRVWSFKDLLPPELVPAGWEAIDAPWLVRPADDGSGRLVLGLTGWATLPGPTEKTVSYEARNVVVSLDLQAPELSRWTLPVDALGVSSEVLVVPPGPSQPATLLWSNESCGSGLTLWEEGVSTGLALPADHQCPVLGALLDTPSRTFAYTTWVDDAATGQRQRLVISQAGEELFRLDGMKVGLSERPFVLLGVARVAGE